MRLSFIPLELLAVPELQQVLTWRNHPQIRIWMNNTEEISLEDHLVFVNSLKTTARKAAYLVKTEDRGIGVIQLNGVEGKSVKDVGLYVNPAFLKRGAGYRLGFHGAWFLFDGLGFETLHF